MKNTSSYLIASLVLTLSGCTAFYDEDPVHEMYEKQKADQFKQAEAEKTNEYSNPVAFFIKYIDSKKTTSEKLLGLITREKYTVKNFDDHVSIYWRDFLSTESDKSSGSMGVAFKEFCHKNSGEFIGHWCVSQNNNDTSLLFYFRATQSVEYSTNDGRLREYATAELLAPVDGGSDIDEWNKFSYREYLKDQKQLQKQSLIDKKEKEDFIKYLQYKQIEPKLIESSIGHQVCKKLNPVFDFPMAVGVVEAAANGKIKIRLTSWFFYNYRKPYSKGTIIWGDTSNWSLCH